MGSVYRRCVILTQKLPRVSQRGNAGRKNREVLRKKKNEGAEGMEKRGGGEKNVFHVTTPDYNVVRVSRVVNARVFKIN